MEELITVPDLLDYLGAEHEHTGYVTSLRGAAIKKVEAITHIDWETGGRDAATVNEIVRSFAWLSFYTLRGGGGNAEYQIRHLTALYKQLEGMTDDTDTPGGDTDTGRGQRHI